MRKTFAKVALISIIALLVAGGAFAAKGVFPKAKLVRHSKESSRSSSFPNKPPKNNVRILKQKINGANANKQSEVRSAENARNVPFPNKPAKSNVKILKSKNIPRFESKATPNKGRKTPLPKVKLKTQTPASTPAVSLGSTGQGLSRFRLAAVTGVDLSANVVLTAQADPSSVTNLLSNGDLETTDPTGAPIGWGQDVWGVNSAIFTYPVVGVNGSKAAQVQMNSYTSGDAKWYFQPISLPAGTYTYSDSYKSDVPTYIDVQIQNADGTYTYDEIGYQLPASPNGFTAWTGTLTVPAGAQNVTVFHLIQNVGSLAIDNVMLAGNNVPAPTPTVSPVITPLPTPSGAQDIFSTGAVTLSFDDGWLSQYQNAKPKLDSVGMKGTFFIVSRQLADFDFSGFMSEQQVKNLYNDGMEIGAHTQTHPDLPLLTASQQQTEIAGSRQDLLALNVGPVTDFTYPYGDYNAAIIQLVINDGFSGAGATLDGTSNASTDPYQLPRFSLQNTTTFSQVKAMIDNALASHTWLILTFHQIDTSGTQYSTTPADFNQIVDYLSQNRVPMVTVDQGVAAINAAQQ